MIIKYFNLPKQRGEGTQPSRELSKRRGALSMSRSWRKPSQGEMCCIYERPQRRRSTQLLSHFLRKAARVQPTESEKQDSKKRAGARVRRASLWQQLAAPQETHAR